MACPPIHDKPPRKTNVACPEAVFVTGGALDVCGMSNLEELLIKLLAKPQYQILHTPVCVAGQNFIRVDRYKNGALDVAGLTWFGPTGAVVTAPPSYTLGECCCGGGPKPPACCDGSTVEFIDCTGKVIDTFTNVSGQVLDLYNCDGELLAHYACDVCDPLVVTDCEGKILVSLGA